jgi:periplasmic divalent cation tolerance protein
MSDAPTRSRNAACIVVLVTCPSRRIAETIAETLVAERLAACANCIPGVSSIYRWEGKVCRDREVLLLLKTRQAKLTALAGRIRSLHPYTVPEIIALPISGGSPAYLSWVRQSTA